MITHHFLDGFTTRLGRLTFSYNFAWHILSLWDEHLLGISTNPDFTSVEGMFIFLSYFI
jgi:hypothetical protein